MKRISDFGWDRYLQSVDAGESGFDANAVGRVVGEHRDSYRIVTEEGESDAVLAGAFRSRASRRSDLPAVGDWVETNGGDRTSGYRISRVLPRSATLSRKEAGALTEEQILAANVDVVCIVGDLAVPRNHHPRTIERYVTAVWESGATPVIVLNKSDACEEREDPVFAVEAAAPGVELHVVSCVTGDGIEALAASLGSGLTVAFVGRSGVGKSSLINTLAGTEIMATGDVRDGDHKGRHTTTGRELARLPTGLLVIDTPGLREFALWGEESALENTFDDIAEYAAACRFRDCAHTGEPGCAVQEALATGELDMGRYESYLRLQRELAYLRSKEAQKERATREARNRELAKFQRRFKKHRADERSGDR